MNTQIAKKKKATSRAPQQPDRLHGGNYTAGSQIKTRPICLSRPHASPWALQHSTTHEGADVVLWLHSG